MRAHMAVFLSTLAFSLPAIAEEDDTYQATVRKLIQFGLVHLTVSGDLPDGTTMTPIEGTGFFVSDDGDVVTAKHVGITKTKWDQFADRLRAMNLSPIGYARQKLRYVGRLKKDDAVSFTLQLIATSDVADIALLRVVTWTDRLREKSWPILPIAAPRDNMHVCAWGFPLREMREWRYGGDFVAAVSYIGIVDAEGSIELVSAPDLRLEAGTSGGPVFNRKGQIVGLVYGGREGVPSGYFTPGNLLAAFLQQQGVRR